MTVVIYSRKDCIWCDKAKALLNEKGIPFEEKVLSVDYTKEDLQRLVRTTSKLTVPQIFIDGSLIGGFEQLQLHILDKDQNDKA